MVRERKHQAKHNGKVVLPYSPFNAGEVESNCGFWLDRSGEIIGHKGGYVLANDGKPGPGIPARLSDRGIHALQWEFFDGR